MGVDRVASIRDLYDRLSAMSTNGFDINNERKPTPDQISDLQGIIPENGILDSMINNLSANKITAGKILSQDIELANNIIDGSHSSCQLRAHIQNFAQIPNPDSGKTSCFILGIDANDGDKAKFFFGNATQYVNWDGSTMTIQGVLQASEIHIPSKNGTANSFHVDINGNMWSGCTYNDFQLSHYNAKAFILNNGESFFQNGMEISTSSTVALTITDNNRDIYGLIYTAGGVNNLVIQNPATGIEITTGAGDIILSPYDDVIVASDLLPLTNNVFSLGSESFYFYQTFTRELKSGFLEPFGAGANMGDAVTRWNRLFINTVDTNALIVNGSAFVPTSISYVTGVSINFTAETYSAPTATKTVLATL